MPKLPDISKITEKIDVEGIIENVKNIVNPGGDTPEPSSDDPIGKKIAEISLLAQHLANEHAQTSKQLQALNHRLNELFKLLEAKLHAEKAPNEPSKSEKPTREE